MAAIVAIHADGRRARMTPERFERAHARDEGWHKATPEEIDAIRNPAADTATADATDTVADDGGAMPAGNAKRDAWADYATSIGIDITDDMSRDDIRTKVLEHDATSGPTSAGDAAPPTTVLDKE